ncbi:hypothetical protein SPAN111604_00015 [Sphingomonas antarctica]|uniref:hypothetical protein n=1 Tax=Sphingomonas antarctica TaxID=2040274 RepID=UPI0039E959F7
MAKFGFVTAVAAIVLAGTGTLAPVWALALIAGGAAVAVLRRRKPDADGEVSC